MPVKLLSSIFCEEVRQDLQTQQISFIGISTSKEIILLNDSPSAECILPALIACFVFRRTDDSDVCDKLIAVEATLSLLLNGRARDGSEKAITIRIPDGKFTVVESFRLPRVTLNHLPEQGVGITNFSAVIHGQRDGKELGRADLRIQVNRRFSSDALSDTH